MLGPLALAGLPVGEETQSEGSKQALQSNENQSPPTTASVMRA